MSFSPQICDEIIADVIGRHQRQIAQLQSMVENSDPAWEERFHDLLRLETELIDIRQGLQAAAYIALAANERKFQPNGHTESIVQRAKARTALQRFRMG